MGKIKALWSLLWARSWWLSVPGGKPPDHYIKTLWYMTPPEVQAVHASAGRICDTHEADQQVDMLVKMSEDPDGS